MKRISFAAFLILFLIFTPIIQSYASDEDVFSAKIPPDALLVLDLSGSMRWTPVGQYLYISQSSSNCGSSTISGTAIAYYPTSGGTHTTQCDMLNDILPSTQYPTTAQYNNMKTWGDSTCAGPYYSYNATGSSASQTNCSRLAIAKSAIKDLLDDYNDGTGTINTVDETSLGIRMGYMRFYNCSADDTGGSYSGGCNTKIRDIRDLGTNNYNDIWSSVNAESAFGGTPLASALNEAKLYLDYSKNNDTLKDCRKKFAILVTDGSDTYACGGSGTETQTDMYKRRRETVAKAKALSDAGYNLFVIGFGAGMPHFLRNTLNWAAYYGKTDNPNDANSGNPPNGYNIQSGLYPSGISSCSNSPYGSHDLGDGSHYYATSNDPGEASIAGYAFIATDPSELTKALKAIAEYIKDQTYYFTSPTVPSVQLVEGDTMYVSSFEPKNDNPFWPGNLKAYQLNADGTLPANAQPIWSVSFPVSRTIKTYRRGGFVDFNSSNLTKEDLGLATDSERDVVMSYVTTLKGDVVLGTDGLNYTCIKDHIAAAGNRPITGAWGTYWAQKGTGGGTWVEGMGYSATKLGDIIHSNAVIVGEPSRFFEDEGFSGTGGFYQANKDRTKVVIVGADDGMLHAFNANTGAEAWAFIPNSLLKTLKLMTSNHTYYVDSSPKVADVWFDSNGNNRKTTDEWRTVLVCGLRKGGKSYFALDITNTLSPQYLWEFPNPSDAATLAKVGQSWSEPAIGRVKIEQGGNLIERWVAFIGGGFDPNETRTTPASVGKALFVIDIGTGGIIKEFSGLSGMNYSFAAPPTAVDTNSDGFVDKVYIGDLGGQMWVFDVSFNEATKKSNSLWTGKILFTAPVSSSEKHSIYYQPAVALDRSGKSWVYFGTGDRENPNDYTNQNERFYAVKDDGLGTYPRGESNLLDVTSSNTFTQPQDPLKGWFIKLEKSGNSLEKVLAKPVVFNQLVYFTTYTFTVSTNPCATGGSGKVYIVEYLSGGGAASTLGDNLLPSTPSGRSVPKPFGDSGSGVPSAPVISVNSEGKASVTIMTTSGQILSQKAFSPTASKAPLYWREVIP